MALDERPKAALTAEEREEIFMDSYGNDLDAGRSLGAIVLEAGKLLAEILPADDVNAGMARMLEGFLPEHQLWGRKFNLPEEWAEALEETGYTECFSEWPMGGVMHDLAAYAVYGIVLHTGDADAREAHLKSLIDRAEHLYERVPTSLWARNKEIDYLHELDDLMTLVRGRWALDNLQPITPAALAHFGGLSEGRIRNLMSGKDRIFNAKEGLIPANEALAWLDGRDSYYPSIWREQQLEGYGARPDTGVLWRVWFVPVARDGSVFAPGLRRGGSFAVGPKGDEEHMEKFEEALDFLQSMKTPYWRRPNAAGHWGIVRGIRWARLSDEELRRFAENRDLRLATADGGG